YRLFYLRAAHPRDLHSFPTRRSSDLVAKVNLALAGLPSFTAIEALAGAAQGDALAERTRAALAGRIHIGPEIDYLERAFDASRRSEEHTSELQSRENLVCRLLLEKKK